MNSRKRNFSLQESIDQIKEEITSSNMSIDEDSSQNEPLSSNKSLLYNKQIKPQINSQQRPKMKFSLNQSKIEKKIIKKKYGINSAFTSKKRKKSKNKEGKSKFNKEKNDFDLDNFSKDDLDLDTNEENFTSISNKLINDIMQSFTSFNYSEFDLRNYFSNNHLHLTQVNDPYIELKVLCTSDNVDLRCVQNSYIIGENGLDCSMKNHDRFFEEINNYKKKVDITLRISKRSKFSFLPVQIWFGIIHFLKPKLCLEIQDQGTIYGSYVKIDGLSVVNLLINTYILLSDSRGDLFNFFKSDFMYNQIVNNFETEQLIYNSRFVNGNLEQINSMPIIQVIQKIFYELRRSSTKTVCKNIKEYLNKNLNNFLLNPYGDEFAYESLFNKANKVLKANQFYLTSANSGLIVSSVGNLGNILSDILFKYNNFQNLLQDNDVFHQITVSILSIGKICPEQKLEQNSRIYSVNYNSINDLPSINTFDGYLNEKAIQLIETEGDPCGHMSNIRIIILVDTLFRDESNSNAFSILFQRGFVLGKNKYTCLHCPLFDCNLFISYSIQAKCWAINEVSNLFRNNNNSGNNSNNNNYINEQFFGLYLCTSEPKGYDNRFKEKKYCVKQGDKIKISDTVLEVKFHI